MIEFIRDIQRSLNISNKLDFNINNKKTASREAEEILVYSTNASVEKTPLQN